jgi:hypothetical protein
MYKIIGGDQKEYGPATAEEMRRWIAEGRLSAQSLVKAETTTEWKPLGTFPEFSEALRTQPGSSDGPPIRRTGASGRFGIGACLAGSGKLLRENLTLLYGASFVVWAIGYASQFHLLALMTFTLLRGVFYGGLCLLILKRIRGEPAAIRDVFSGFSIAFPQLLLAGFLTSVISMISLVCCFVIPGIYLIVAWIFAVPLVADQRLEFWSAMESSRKAVTRVWFQAFLLMFLAFLPYVLINLFVQVKTILAMLPMMQDLFSMAQPDPRKIEEIIKHVPRPSSSMLMAIELLHLLVLPYALGALMYAYEALFGARTGETA